MQFLSAPPAPRGGACGGSAARHKADCRSPCRLRASHAQSCVHDGTQHTSFAAEQHPACLPSAQQSPARPPLTGSASGRCGRRHGRAASGRCAPAGAAALALQPPRQRQTERCPPACILQPRQPCQACSVAICLACLPACLSKPCQAQQALTVAAKVGGKEPP